MTTQSSAWTLADSELPPEGTEVFVMVAVRRGDDVGFLPGVDFVDEGDWYHHGTVTYWMPIPPITPAGAVPC